jgi:hypothetical protein
VSASWFHQAADANSLRNNIVWDTNKNKILYIYIHTYTLREFFFEFAKANNFIRENCAKVGDHESLHIIVYIDHL